MIPDDELSELAKDVMSFILNDIHYSDEIVKRIWNIYWGDAGFIEKYNNVLEAIKFLEKKGYIRKEDTLQEINGKTIKKAAYYPNFVT